MGGAERQLHDHPCQRSVLRLSSARCSASALQLVGDPHEAEPFRREVVGVAGDQVQGVLEGDRRLEGVGEPPAVLAAEEGGASAMARSIGRVEKRSMSARTAAVVSRSAVRGHMLQSTPTSRSAILAIPSSYRFRCALAS